MDTGGLTVIFLFAVNRTTITDNHLRMMAMVASSGRMRGNLPPYQRVAAREDVFAVISEINGGNGNRSSKLISVISQQGRNCHLKVWVLAYAAGIALPPGKKS